MGMGFGFRRGGRGNGARERDEGIKCGERTRRCRSLEGKPMLVAMAGMALALPRIHFQSTRAILAMEYAGIFWTGIRGGPCPGGIP